MIKTCKTLYYKTYTNNWLFKISLTLQLKEKGGVGEAIIWDQTWYSSSKIFHPFIAAFLF